jgi:hypothetical protein
VYEEGRLIGIVYFEGMLARRDIDAHMVFFDRQPHEKVPVSRLIVEYMFNTFPIRSIVVAPPTFYRATLRMVTKLGFKFEGIMKGMTVIGGKVCDQAVYRITRSAVCPS